MRSQPLATTLAVAAMFAFAGLAGCTTANAQTGSAAFYVKDAPTDGLAHLYVSFTSVELHLKHEAKTNSTDDDHDNETAEDHEDDDDASMSDVQNGTSPGMGRVSVSVEENDDDHADGEGRWITIFSGNATVDLRALNGTAKGFLGDGEVPIGVYNAIRIRVSSATAVYDNGTSVAVKVPSKALHIVGKFRVEQDKETALTLDFDLARSLKQTGNGTLWLKPVLHLEQERRERPGHDERERRMKERDERDADGRDKVREHRGQHGDD